MPQKKELPQGDVPLIPEPPPTKRVLALSGGGSKGAWQAGVINYLMNNLGLRYHAYCGISVGAINCLHMAQFKDSEVSEAVAKLVQFWEGISTKQVYKSWCFGKLAALWKPSVYNSRPLAKYLVSRFSLEKLQQSGKELRVGAVSMDTGDYRLFTEEDPDILQGVLASAAYPVMFLTVSMDGNEWVDGGIRNVTPLGSAFGLGATEADVIMCTPTNKVWSPLEKPKAIDNLGRMMDIMLDEIIDTDLALANAYNELARLGQTNRRHIKMRVIRPKVGLPGSSLNFDSHIEEKIQMGWEDAKRVCG
jgi:NTE family protein